MATITQISEATTESQIDVVFVHGLMGDPRTTWEFTGNNAGDEYHVFWPQDLAEDLPLAKVWTVGYDSSPTKWKGKNIPLIDRAGSLLDLLDAHEIGARPVVFITHSLGGLLTKAILRASHDMPKDDDKHTLHRNTRGVVFFSTPHTGSSLTNLANSIPGGRPTEIVRELSQNDAYLRDLSQWFSDKAKELSYACLTYFESYKTMGYMVVDAVSANPNHGMRPVPFDGDHFSICKVPDRSDQRFKQVVKFIKKAASFKVEVAKERDLQLIDGIDFAIGVDPNPPQDGRVIEFHPPSRTLVYCVSASSSCVRIKPRMKYRELMSSSAIVDPVDFYWNPFRCQFPSLDVVVVNNTHKTLVLTGATLEVMSSKPDFSPLIVIPSNTWGMKLVIKNEGWGKLSNVLLRCNLLPTSAPGYMPDPSIEHVKIGTDFAHEFVLGDFAESVELDLRETLGKLGVDIEAISQAGFRSQTLYAMRALQAGIDTKHAKHMGRFPEMENDSAWSPFPDGYVVVAGRLDFDSVDREGQPYHYSLPIRARVFMFNIRYDLPMPPSYQYTAELEHTGENYFVPIGVCHSLKPGEADRFTIRLACSQSAFHEFRIRWEFAGGLSSYSCPIMLEQVVPRTFASEELAYAKHSELDPDLDNAPTVFDGNCVEHSIISAMQVAQASEQIRKDLDA